MITISHFLFPMRKIGLVISDLNPVYEFQGGLNRKSSHGQHVLDQNSKLRKRNRRCFFSPT